MICTFLFRETVITRTFVSNYSTKYILLYPMCCMGQLLVKEITKFVLCPSY